MLMSRRVSFLLALSFFFCGVSDSESIERKEVQLGQDVYFIWANNDVTGNFDLRFVLLRRDDNSTPITIFQGKKYCTVKPLAYSPDFVHRTSCVLFDEPYFRLACTLKNLTFLDTGTFILRVEMQDKVFSSETELYVLDSHHPPFCYTTYFYHIVRDYLSYLWERFLSRVETKGMDLSF